MAPTKFKNSRVDLTILAVAAVWGGSYLAARELTKVASIGGLLAVRFLLAGLVLALLWFYKRERFSKTDVLLGTVFGLTQASIMWVETWGLSVTTATNAGLIISLTILFTPILESAWKRSWLPRGFFIATVVSFLGLAMLVGGNGITAPNYGDALMLLAALVRTFHVTAQGRLTEGRKVSSLNAIMMQCLVCGICYLIADPSGAWLAASTFDTRSWLLMAFLVLLCSVFAFAAQLWAIKKTSASRASLLLSTEPIWAVAVGTAIGGELLGWIGYLGAAIIIVASYVGQGIERRHREGKVSVSE
ncbi:MAG: DMT family transporter [Microbacteriaceae bacterium]|nr:DMT family transporter [Microbacteriaceae bacterium]